MKLFVLTEMETDTDEAGCLSDAEVFTSANAALDVIRRDERNDIWDENEPPTLHYSEECADEHWELPSGTPFFQFTGKIRGGRYITRYLSRFEVPDKEWFGAMEGMDISMLVDRFIAEKYEEKEYGAALVCKENEGASLNRLDVEEIANYFYAIGLEEGRNLAK